MSWVEDSRQLVVAELSFMYLLNMEVTNDKVSLSDGVHNGDINVAILLMTIIRPVLGALDLALFCKVGEHHNSGDVVVPDHPPEGSFSGRSHGMVEECFPP